MSEAEEVDGNDPRVTWFVVRILYLQSGIVESPVLGATTSTEAEDGARRLAGEMNDLLKRATGTPEVMGALGITKFKYEVRGIRKHSNVLLAPPGSRIVSPG